MSQYRLERIRNSDRSVTYHLYDDRLRDACGQVYRISFSADAILYKSFQGNLDTTIVERLLRAMGVPLERLEKFYLSLGLIVLYKT